MAGPTGRVGVMELLLWLGITIVIMILLKTR
jgi:hypothetical protein